jgi:hypothetical protein
MNVLRKKGISGREPGSDFLRSIYPIQPVILAQVSLRLQKRRRRMPRVCISGIWRLHFPECSITGRLSKISTDNCADLGAF